MDPNNSFKVVVVGTSGVGKTAIVRQLIEGNFREEGQPTIGVEFKIYSFRVGEEVIKLQIWDTAGQERFRAVSKAYFRNAMGAVLVYDITQRQSFEELNGWLNDLRSLCAPNATIIMIGNKVDLAEDRTIAEAEAQEFSERYNLEYFETSAKNGHRVAEAFVRLGQQILMHVKSSGYKPPAPIDEKKLTETKSNTSNGCNC